METDCAGLCNPASQKQAFKIFVVKLGWVGPSSSSGMTAAKTWDLLLHDLAPCSIARGMEAVGELLKNDKEKWQVEDVCKYNQVLL